MPKVSTDLTLCDGCGVCVSVCPADVLEIYEGKVMVANPEACLGVLAEQSCSECMRIEARETCEGCVACVKNCPSSAISIA